MSTLDKANAARTDYALNKFRRDSANGAVYTLRGRIDQNAYAYRTVHTESGKRDSYGLILRAELGSELGYLTPVVPVPKIVFDYASSLPVATFDEDKGSVA